MSRNGAVITAVLITDVKFYVPVVVSSISDHIRLLEQLKSEF